MVEVRYKNFEQLSFADVAVYQAIPPHPFWSAVDELVDFSFADDLCAPLYSHKGPRPYPPSLKLKIHLVQRYYDISDREMELKIIGDIYVKRFLGLPIDHAKFDHSTIGLDRTRLGAEMFDACHHYILAQAMAYGLWGQDDDRWLVDAFHTYAHVSRPSTYELVRQAVYKVLHHMKYQNRAQYDQLEKEKNVPAMRRCVKSNAETKERWMAFSSLVVHAYGLLAWIESKERTNRFPWTEDEHGQFQEHVQFLRRVLQENVRKVNGSDSNNQDPKVENGSTEQLEDAAMYEELSKDKKPSDRIISVSTPDVRVGAKSKTVRFTGDKIQVVESAISRLILNAEPIAGNEGDGETLVPVVQEVVEAHGVKPKEIVADSAYGSVENRYRVQHDLHTQLVSPVRLQGNPDNLFTNEQFRYQSEQQNVVCPNGKISYRSQHIKEFAGTQFHFRKEDCACCPLRTQCTKAKAGRAVFFVDHWNLIQEAKQYNETEAGQAALKERREIERTNNEMKNHHGLVRPRTHGRAALRIDAKVTAMVVNLKVMVKSLKSWPRCAQVATATS